MKLFNTSIKSHKSEVESLLVEGNIEEIAAFVNSVNDGYGVGGPLTEADLDENGGAWGALPDGWTKETPFYYETPTDRKGGYSTLEEAVQAMVSDCEDYILQK